MIHISMNFLENEVNCSHLLQTPVILAGPLSDLMV